MRFIEKRVELSDIERICVISSIVLSLSLTLFTYGIVPLIVAWALFFYYNSEKKKDQETRQKVKEIEDSFERTQNKLLESYLYESYLTSPEENNLHPVLNEALLRLKAFKPKYDHIVDEFIGRLFSYSNHLQNYNETYIATQHIRHQDFFSGRVYHKGLPFNENQVRAILTNDINTLVIAGPGAGKTRVLTSRAAFFVNRMGIAPQDILILAYNKRAVNEIIHRLSKRFGIENVEVRTFHSLGNRILKQSGRIGRQTNIEGKSESVIRNIVEELVDSDNEFQTEFLSYALEFGKPDDAKSAEPELVDERFRHLLQQSYRAIDGTKVASLAERNIANYFIQHGIEYEYEHKVTWCDQDSEEPDKSYHPDFYLPDFDIYLEHWAVSSDYKAPDFFTLEETISYLRNLCWKRIQFRKHGKVLWETYHTDFSRKRLIPKLEEYLISIGEKPTRLPYSILLKKIGLEPEAPQTVRNMISDAIKIAKIYGLTSESLAWHVKSIADNIPKKKKQVKFLQEIVVPIFERYERYLSDSEAIDFEDMINLAVKTIEQSESSHHRRYKMILVDEFQDISYQRLQLLTSLQELDPDCRLFCVGDDWQAIYGFAGSSTRHMIQFERGSRYLARVDLVQNYRNPPDILDFGSETIDKCSEKIDKTLLPRSLQEDENQDSILIFDRIEGGNQFDFRNYQNRAAMDLIERLVSEGVEPSEILVLSRFNFGFGDLRKACIDNDAIPVELVRKGKVVKQGIRFMTVHKSKGLEADYVLLLNVFEGTFGFPSEIKSKMDFDIINQDMPDTLDEERRLFFVAVTRARKGCRVFAWSGYESKFLVENSQFQSQFHVPENPEFYGTIIEERPDAYYLQADFSPSFKPLFWVGKSQVAIEPMETENEIVKIRLTEWVYNKTYRERWKNQVSFLA